jgi:hypothetical protein
MGRLHPEARERYLILAVGFWRWSVRIDLICFMLFLGCGMTFSLGGFPKGKDSNQVAGYGRNGWQDWTGIDGSMPLDSGGFLPGIPACCGRLWPESLTQPWQVSAGISGRFGLEYPPGRPLDQYGVADVICDRCFASSETIEVKSDSLKRFPPKLDLKLPPSYA